MRLDLRGIRTTYDAFTCPLACEFNSRGLFLQTISNCPAETAVISLKARFERETRHLKFASFAAVGFCDGNLRLHLPLERERELPGLVEYDTRILAMFESIRRLVLLEPRSRCPSMAPSAASGFLAF